MCLSRTHCLSTGRGPPSRPPPEPGLGRTGNYVPGLIYSVINLAHCDAAGLASGPGCGCAIIFRSVSQAATDPVPAVGTHSGEFNLTMSKLDGHSLDHEDAALEPTDPTEQGEQNFNTTAATVATVAVVGVGALVFEAALIPGLALGVAAMLVPKFLPQIGTAINPLVKSTVRSAYRVGRKTREMVAEAEEHVHDIVAEVDAEADAKAAAAENETGKRATAA